MPAEWSGKAITGTLTIHHNWGTCETQPDSATFSADGQSVNVWGGKPDGKHFFND